MNIRPYLPLAASALISCAHKPVRLENQAGNNAEIAGFLEQCRESVWRNPLFQDPQIISDPSKTTDDIGACIDAALDAGVIFLSDLGALPQGTRDRIDVRARVDIDTSEPLFSQTPGIQAGDCGSSDVERNPILYTLDELASDYEVPNPAFFKTGIFGINRCLVEADTAGHLPFEPGIQKTINARLMTEWDLGLSGRWDDLSKKDFGYPEDSPPYFDGLTTALWMQAQLQGYVDFSHTVQDALHDSCEFHLEEEAISLAEMSPEMLTSGKFWCDTDAGQCYNSGLLAPCILNVQLGAWSYEDLGL